MAELLSDEARDITAPQDIANYVGGKVVIVAEHFRYAGGELDEARTVFGTLLAFEWVQGQNSATVDFIFEGGHTHREPIRMDGAGSPRIRIDYAR